MKNHRVDEGDVRPICARLGAMVVLTLAASCGRTLSPPAAPERVVPTNFISIPPEPGLGHVLLDTPDGPATVVEVTSRSSASASGAYGVWADASGETTRAVCTTPCEVNLPYGTHELRFTLVDDGSRESTANIVAGEHPSVARHAVGRREVGSLPYIFAGLTTVFAGVAAGTGALFYTVPPLYPTDGNGNPTSSPSGAALPTLIGGGALVVVSIALMLILQPVNQDGSTSQWVLSPPP
jgi:hypothetical protein